jgi:Tfp pilus assembly protein PilF
MEQTGPSIDFRGLKQRAIATHRAGHLDEARTMYSEYLSRAPDDARVWTNLGVLLRSGKALDLALRAQERAYSLDSRTTAIRNNLANILAEVGQDERAILIRRQMLAETPDDPDTVAMLGKSLRSLGRHDEAVQLLTGGMAEHPDATELQMQRALSHLSAGRYAEGFRDYEVRWRTGELTVPKVKLPKWSGESLEGRSILVLSEQGLGDTILCARFLPYLRRRGGTVFFICKKPILRLLRQLDGVDWVGVQPPKDVSLDCWTNLMDVPRYAFEDHDEIPAPATLTIPADSKRRAIQTVAPFQDRYRVGVVWSGSTTYRFNHLRSFSHTRFLPLSDIAGVQLFSLYKGPLLEAYQADGASAFLLDTGSGDRDLADCAATMQRMDLIITSDTAAAHIAGSMGLEVWNLLHWSPFWLYGTRGDDSRWYPSMRLIRQDRPRNWDELFIRVQSALEERVTQRLP